ncbi:MAG: alcohol dehydrogenase catalytic domain-containing protein [Lachnospiraceae bacterium]|jgi:ribitol-5-phosphate 2-dehydrogenase|nr:alcohol dehydrogenase catalytic domain-containing protein [Lachnospiraceae bacterium]
MIGRVYRLIDTKRIELKQREIPLSADTVLVRPEYLSICAADQRYYLGQRRKEVLRQKLPMALIHEATGTVIKDFSGCLANGTKVVLLPLDESGAGEAGIKGNYRPESNFASSGSDGFMRDVVAISGDRLIPIGEDYSNIYVFTELLSVALGAIKAFETARQTPAEPLGVWGDGSMGFMTALALRCQYPQTKIYAFGKSARKLSKFSFATDKHYVDAVPNDLIVNHAFECVGGRKSEDALKQIMDHISPQGTVNLLGVSENTVGIDTRRVLDKGLQLIGNSRSDKSDFEEAAALIRDNEICRKYIGLLVSEVVEVKSDDDIPHAFEQDVLNDFKTVIKWEI